MKVCGKSFHERDSKAILSLLQPVGREKEVDLLVCCRYNFSMVLERLKPKEALGFLTWKVARLITNDLSARFVEAGIAVTVEQGRAIIPLFKLNGWTQGRVWELLSQEKTGVSRLVAALEKRHLIRREANEDDRRVKHIYITEAGRELIESTIDMVSESREKQIEHIDSEELAICKRVLWQIIKPTLDDDCLIED